MAQGQDGPEVGTFTFVSEGKENGSKGQDVKALSGGMGDDMLKDPEPQVEAKEFGWKYGTEELYNEFNSRFPGLGATKQEFEEGFYQAYWNKSNGYNDLDKARLDSFNEPGFLNLVAAEIEKIIQ